VFDLLGNNQLIDNVNEWHFRVDYIQSLMGLYVWNIPFRETSLSEKQQKRLFYEGVQYIMGFI
jgi:hypothetical protein